MDIDQIKVLCRDATIEVTQHILMRCQQRNISYEEIKEVIKNGYRYDIPQCCTDRLKQYQQDNSPVLTFFNECCIMREQENGKKRNKGMRM